LNPLQFGPSEDFAKYPRNPAGDAALAEREGATVLFAPTAEEMFPKGFSSHVAEDVVSKPLCGLTRPQFFRGVLTCWLKLFHVLHPWLLLVGEKDAQLVAVVRKFAADLLLPLEIVAVPVVRDADGLPCSARNAYLTPTQRDEALAVYRSLLKAKEMVDGGVKSADRLVAEVTHILAEKRRLRVIYISVVDRNNMEPLREIFPGQCLMAIAYWVDEVRLTDNFQL
ncbi:MAG: pantoate--beta-alanine ligase, partial [Opitutae bacterium]|nr:pantoate--beta-alanine ligase [Opitutae bacterium]